MLALEILNLIVALLNGAALLCLLLTERRESGKTERPSEEPLSASARRMDQGFENLMSYTVGRGYRLGNEEEWV